MSALIECTVGIHLLNQLLPLSPSHGHHFSPLDLLLVRVVGGVSPLHLSHATVVVLNVQTSGSLRDHGVAPSMVTSSAAAAEDSTIRPALRTRSLPSTRLVTLWEGRRRARETPTAFR